MKKLTEYIVRVTWNCHEMVWRADCSEIEFGLKSGSFDALVEKVKIAAPDLLRQAGANPECVLHFVAERRDWVEGIM